MKGGLALIILEALGEAVVDSAILLQAFLNAGYGASGGKINYEFRKLEVARRRAKDLREAEGRERQRYYKVVSRLKRDRLIAQEPDGHFRITLRGRQKRIQLKKRRAQGFPEPRYEKQKSKNFIIVAFDVPEREREKRSWLRAVLKNLGLKMVQQSVWIGRTQIPKEFLRDIKELRLATCIEIFEVGKTGTLEQLL